MTVEPPAEARQVPQKDAVPDRLGRGPRLLRRLEVVARVAQLRQDQQVGASGLFDEPVEVAHGRRYVGQGGRELDEADFHVTLRPCQDVA